MMIRNGRRTVFSLSALLLLSAVLFSVPLRAQVAQASLSGTVTDPGNRIPAAQ